MSIKISGILKDGIGKPIPNCTIELISKKTTLNVITKTEANLLIDSAGSYSMNVEPSEYSVSLYIEGFSPKYVGNIRVYSDSKPCTLNDFLMLPGESDLTPELVATFLKLRDEAEQTAKEAKQSAEGAKESASEANAAADSSTDILNQVTEIHLDITNKHEQVGLDATEIREAVETATSAAGWAGTYANQAAGMAQAAENHNNYAQRAAQDAEKAKVASEASAKNALSSSTAADNSKAGAESAKRDAEAAALTTAQDRAAVSADKQTVSNDKASAEQAAATASASALAAESDKVRAEAAESNASDSASAANASAVAANAAANSVKSLSATGEILSPGSPASAEWDAETNTLIIGVPQGDIGPQGEKGEQGVQGDSIKGDIGPQGEKGDKGDPGPASGINEAPADGKIYGRKDAAWAEVTSGGGAGTVVSVDGVLPNVSGDVILGAARKGTANSFSAQQTFNAGVAFNGLVVMNNGLSSMGAYKLAGYDVLNRVNYLTKLQINVGNSPDLFNIVTSSTPVTTIGNVRYELYHSGNLPKANPGYNGDLVYLSSVASITDMNNIPTSRYLINNQEIVVDGPNIGKKWANQPIFADEQVPQVEVYLIETVNVGDNQFGTSDVVRYQTISNYLDHDKSMLFYRAKHKNGTWDIWKGKTNLFPSLPYNKFTDGALGTSVSNLLLSQSAKMGEYYTQIPFKKEYVLNTINDNITKNLVFSFEFLSIGISANVVLGTLSFTLDMGTFETLLMGSPVVSNSSLGQNPSNKLAYVLNGELSFDGNGFILSCTHDSFLLTKVYINGPTLQEIEELGIGLY